MPERRSSTHTRFERSQQIPNVPVDSSTRQAWSTVTTTSHVSHLSSLTSNLSSIIYHLSSIIHPHARTRFFPRAHDRTSSRRYQSRRMGTHDWPNALAVTG